MDDITGTERWLTYDELAALRGIKRIGAVRLVQRHKWRRQAGNDGLARVLVPHDALEPVRRTNADTDAGISSDTGAPGISSPTNDGTSSPTAAGTVAPDILERLVAQVNEGNKRADVAVALADRTLAQLAEAHAERAAAMTRAERAEALVANLERDVATRAEMAVQLRAERDQARQHAREAEDAIGALRQADEERKGRGRWARLREAWLGR